MKENVIRNSNGKGNSWIICLLLASLQITFLTSQEAPSNIIKWGTSLGSSMVGEGMPEGDTYEPILFHLFATKQIGRYKNRKGQFWYYGEIQAAVDWENADRVTDFDCGINFGLRYTYRLVDTIKIYLQGNIGPHYFSKTTLKQAKGFVFSDNVGLGFEIRLFSTLQLDIQFRYRHLSNAGLTDPNVGIDNQYALLGLVF